MQDDPQFGAPDAGIEYRDRPAAFGLALKDQRLALVKVTYADRASFFDLPGGAIDPGERPEQALIREFGEETGLIVRAGALLTKASQRFRKKDGEPVNNRCSFFEAVVEGADEGLKIEQDHELVWLEPIEALKVLRLEAHAWALAAWLRKAP
ncbi:MAG TPA: NUDIX domain-containing protein [Caulobacteraceae bacterium]|nr:NUDIX domain-containing protein [Caulobacteraceae bacterium]